jgi:hypothetical protein
MERSGKRGKIPQQDWPSIIARYEAGETLASIARTYDCSPPAISYILSRTRARTTAAAALAAAAPAENKGAAPPPQEEGNPPSDAMRPAEPAALKETASEQGNGLALPSQGHAAPGVNPSASRPPALPPGGISGNGAQNGPPVGQGRGLTADRGLEAHSRDTIARGPQEEVRRTLHLSHGQMNGPERNGDAQPDHGLGARPPAPRSVPAELPYPQPARQSPSQSPGPLYAQGNGTPLRVLAEPRSNPREGGAIDQALRERVHTELAAFLVAFDAALADDTPESRAGLREATDRLLRAGARTRIELERLEARLPLPARDAFTAAPAWRQR